MAKTVEGCVFVGYILHTSFYEIKNSSNNDRTTGGDRDTVCLITNQQASYGSRVIRVIVARLLLTMDMGVLTEYLNSTIYQGVSLIMRAT